MSKAKHFLFVPQYHLFWPIFSMSELDGDLPPIPNLALQFSGSRFHTYSTLFASQLENNVFSASSGKVHLTFIRLTPIH